MQITADISALSKAQKDALVSFIITFPSIPDTRNQPPLPFLEPNSDFSGPELEAASAFGQPQIMAGIAPSPRIALVQPAPPATDRAGLPWDERIHASSKALTADGFWRQKRGVSEALIAEVKTQYGVVTAPTVPAPVTAAVAIPPPPAPVAVAAAVPAPVAVAAAVPAPVAVAAAVAPNDLRDQCVALFGRASAAMTASKMTKAELDEICGRHGIASLPLLTTRLDLVPAVAAEIDLMLASRP